MKFEVTPLDDAEGAILAHTVRWESGSMRKGIRLGRREIARLRAAKVASVMAAREEFGDLHENAAAERMARAVAPDPERHGLRVGPARHGRVNLFATMPGVIRIRTSDVTNFNRVSEAAAISTLPDFDRVRPGRLVATVKVIPFAISEEIVERAEGTLSCESPAMVVHPVRIRFADLLATRGEWTPESLAARGIDAVRGRLQSLGIPLASAREIPHAEEPLAKALSESSAELLLVLGDTVTSDRGDVVPSAIRRAGGRVRRFGMPVDPGNLLLLAELGDRPLIVLPGCARSPKLNGADWVLERIACGINVEGRDFAAMGVGGLLHEISSRPSPRLGGADTPATPRIPILLLAAGASKRMGSHHKLLRKVGDVPLVAHVAARLAPSRADGIVAQQVSWRRPRATDFRLIQGSIYANGVGILLSGLAGTPPTTSYSSLTVSLVNLTGVAARSVGYAMAGIFLALALFPKVTGVLLTIPGPVMGGFLLTAIGMLFVEGVQTLSRAGLDPQKALVAGLAFSLGLGMENQNVLEGLLGSPWGDLLGNGITVGAVTAIGLTALLELTGPRRSRLDVQLDMSDLPQVDAFLQEVAATMRWDEASTARLRSSGEEALSSLLQPGNERPEGKAKRLIIAARPEGRSVEIEFLTVFDEENLEDRLAYLDEQTEAPDEREVSFRLLRHYASSVRHQKYHGMDIVTVRVDA